MVSESAEGSVLDAVRPGAGRSTGGGTHVRRTAAIGAGDVGKV
jgi:hypothetical protein